MNQPQQGSNASYYGPPANEKSPQAGQQPTGTPEQGQAQEGERGLGSKLAGGTAGGFLGKKLGGGFLGATGGALTGAAGMGLVSKL